MKRYIGKSRADNLRWLADVWLREGPPVCFLQGFSGLGKTDLAWSFRGAAEQEGWRPVVVEEIVDRPTADVTESLIELSSVLSEQGLPDMEDVLTGQTSSRLGYALEQALKHKALIILDEAQRFFQSGSLAPLKALADILAHLRNRQNLPGRLLLLSDRIVEEARWSEWIPKRTLHKLTPEEAAQALDIKLQEAGVDTAIPDSRKLEVVRDLDFNPRAIEALVAALRYENLDEIIESNPGLWEVRDREVSREFLHALERDLLERTMRHLDPADLRSLRRLAVYRRSFKRDAFDKVCGNQAEADRLRSILISRYLLNFNRGVLALNPIVREISLAHLHDHPAERLEGHSTAVDYYLRPFKARQMVGSQDKLGKAFAELRYHLVQADRTEELHTVEQRFTDHLKRHITSVSPVPSDPEELNERIAVLTVLLGDGGAKGLEYHLARCLKSRDKPGDLEVAVLHAERAVGTGASAEPWHLLVALKHENEGVDAAIDVANRAIANVDADKNLFSLYQSAAGILSEAGRTDEAVTLLRQGIDAIPADKSLFSLYQSAAEILSEAGRTDEAVTLLRQGIDAIPADKSLFSLYQSAAEILSEAGRTDEAVTLLRQGIDAIPADKSLHSLYQALGTAYRRAGRDAEAIDSQLEGFVALGRSSTATSSQKRRFCFALRLVT